MLGYRTWICPDCHSKVSQDVYPCPKCQKKVSQIVKQQELKNVCPVCTYSNQQNCKVCIVCQELLRIPSEQKKQTINCPKCKLQNDVKNQICVFCDEDLFQTQKKTCTICGNEVKSDKYDRHYTNCLLSMQVLEQEKKIQQEIKKKQQIQVLKNLEQCIYCRSKFLPTQIENHTIQCKKQAMSKHVFDPTTRMTSLQMEAMRYMSIKSEKQHNQVRVELQNRVKKLKYTIQDLNNLQFYVENYAPIIIHIHISKHMVFFLKDTHYRSQFQTNKSSGSLSRSSRTSWEDRMFDKKYSKATDFERVKYGVINFTNDPKGVGACVAYGQSYFLLKQHVRQRCTFTDMDSSNAHSSIGTFKYCFKILSKLNDNELKAAFDASKAKQVASSCTSTYKQMQVHGPIQFAKDIERIYVNRNELKTDKKLLDMVYEFNKKFGVDYDFF